VFHGEKVVMTMMTVMLIHIADVMYASIFTRFYQKVPGLGKEMLA
jgi:hypothetical protein